MPKRIIQRSVKDVKTVDEYVMKYIIYTYSVATWQNLLQNTSHIYINNFGNFDVGVILVILNLSEIKVQVSLISRMLFLYIIHNCLVLFRVLRELFAYDIIIFLLVFLLLWFLIVFIRSNFNIPVASRHNDVILL